MGMRITNARTDAKLQRYERPHRTRPMAVPPVLYLDPSAKIGRTPPQATGEVPHPRVVHPTSRVTVIAPASAPPDPAAYTEGLQALRNRGFQVEAPETVAPMGYLAGPDDHRLDALNAALRRDDIDAIFCARGGYGTLRLLPHIDFEAAAQNPKLLVGYSDITALQLALFAQAGLPSLAGPMVAPDWSRMDPYSESSFWSLVDGSAPVEILNPYDEPWWTLRKGQAEGLLLGGNLTMITCLLGSPYLPDLDGAILFLEEIGESAYRIDRLLAQLQLAGVLERIGGLIFGAFTDSAAAPGRPTLHVQEVIRYYANFVDGPVAAGAVFGHLRPKASLPIGIKAHLDGRDHASFLTIVEPLTR